MNTRTAFLLIALLAAQACDRRVESFAPGEKPQTPDLSKIFPAGADRAAQPAAQMPLAPGRGAPPVEPLAAPIEGTIELAPELAGSVPAGAVLFLMAHGAAGGPLVAAQRIPFREFPLQFSIGAADHMMSATPFAGPLRISARIDGDGNAATRDAGDLLGASEGTHQPGDRGVVVTISEVQGETTASAPPAAATGATAAAAAPPAALATTASGAIEGTLELAPELAGRVPPRAVLYLIARTAQGGPPIAVVRVDNPSFPMPFSIGPENRMNQSLPFAGEMRISARVDGDGNPMTRTPGDLQGSSEAANAPGDRGVTLLIDEVL